MARLAALLTRRALLSSWILSVAFGTYQTLGLFCQLACHSWPTMSPMILRTWRDMALRSTTTSASGGSLSLTGKELDMFPEQAKSLAGRFIASAVIWS